MLPEDPLDQDQPPLTNSQLPGGTGQQARAGTNMRGQYGQELPPTRGTNVVAKDGTKVPAPKQATPPEQAGGFQIPQFDPNMLVSDGNTAGVQKGANQQRSGMNKIVAQANVNLPAPGRSNQQPPTSNAQRISSGSSPQTPNRPNQQIPNRPNPQMQDARVA